MKTITIRGIDFTDSAELHDYLERELEFPDYYGRNLDALYDVLTDINEPTKITVDMEGMEDDGMYDYISRVIRVLEDASKENEALEIEVI